MDTPLPFLAYTLLVLGLLFPALSLFTVILSLLDQWLYMRHSSPVFVPLIGPILLTSWGFLTQAPIWLVPVFWVADIGTLTFLAVAPGLIRGWWQISPFTRIATLEGSRDIESAVITLHSTGHYVLKKTWKRPAGEIGIVGLGEGGTFVRSVDGYELNADHGVHRALRETPNGAYAVEEIPPLTENQLAYALQGWVLHCRSKS